MFFSKKKKFLVFAFLHFTLIETHPTFKSAESLQTILDLIRLPLIIVTKIMKRLKLKKVFGKENDWGKKWGLIHLRGRKTIMVFFTSFRLYAKGRGKGGIRNFRPASAAFNLSFFKKRFLKSNKWIRMVGVFLLFFFFHYYHQNFHINFWCWIFFKKATQLSFKFLARMFFWSKIIFDENFDVIYFFFQKLHKSCFF